MAKVHRQGMARGLCASAAVAMLLAAGGVAAQHGHRHGVGWLDLSVEGASMTVQLVLALEDVVGFERAPRTAEERARVEAARSRLGDPASLFAVSSEAGCRLRSARIDLNAAVADGARPARGGAQHGDARANYVFDCERPERVRQLDVRLFGGFPSVASLQVQVATAQAQRGARLSAGKRLMSW